MLAKPTTNGRLFVSRGFGMRLVSTYSYTTAGVRPPRKRASSAQYLLVIRSTVTFFRNINHGAIFHAVGNASTHSLPLADLAAIAVMS